MDVNLINPFIGAVGEILGQFGINPVNRKGIALAEEDISPNGLAIKIGISGDKNGSACYLISESCALKVVSGMMGSTINAIDDMAKSALCEMGSMFLANATMSLSSSGTNIKPSVPDTILPGQVVNMGGQYIKIDFDVSGDDLSILLLI